MAADYAPLRRRHRRRRRPHHERPLRGRHASARHLHLQAAVRMAASGWPSPARSATTPMSAGACAGSNASDSTEIYAEGLRIPPLKLYERGKPNATLHDSTATCACRCRCSATSAASLPPATSPSSIDRAGGALRRATHRPPDAGDDRLFRASDAAPPGRAAGWRGDVQGLDRRRPHRLRQADPPVRARCASAAIRWRWTGPAAPRR